MDTTHYQCSICKSDFPFDNIRYGTDGKKLVCTSCFGHDKVVAQKSFSVATPVVASRQSVRREPTSTQGGIEKFQCKDCNYKFSLKEGSKVKKNCPYCGKTRLFKDENSAEKLLQEVTQVDYERSIRHNAR